MKTADSVWGQACSRLFSTTERAESEAFRSDFSSRKRGAARSRARAPGAVAATAAQRQMALARVAVARATLSGLRARAQPPGRGLARTTAARISPAEGAAKRCASRGAKPPGFGRANGGDRANRARRDARAPVFVVRKTGRNASATADFSTAQRIPCFPW